MATSSDFVVDGSLVPTNEPPCDCLGCRAARVRYVMAYEAQVEEARALGVPITNPVLPPCNAPTVVRLQ